MRRGVLLDLGAVGWVPALDWISQSPIENSIKSIALRGLAEHPRGLEPLSLNTEQASQMVPRSDGPAPTDIQILH